MILKKQDSWIYGKLEWMLSHSNRKTPWKDKVKFLVLPKKLYKMNATISVICNLEPWLFSKLHALETAILNGLIFNLWFKKTSRILIMHTINRSCLKSRRSITLLWSMIMNKICFYRNLRLTKRNKESDCSSACHLII